MKTKENTTSQQRAEIQHMSRIFGFPQYGTGSLESGVNTVAAMPLNLANISGSAIHNPDVFAAVGVNFLISGTHSLVSTRQLMNELLVPQRLLTSNIAYAHLTGTYEVQKDSRPLYSKIPGQTWKDEISGDEPFYFSNEYRCCVESLLASGSKQHMREILGTDVMVALVHDKATLNSALRQAHGGNLFAVCPLRSAAEARTLAPHALRLSDGTFGKSLNNRLVTGFTATTLDLDVMSSCLFGETPVAEWLRKTFWLVDGDFGESKIQMFPAANPDDNLFLRYRHALRNIILGRLGWSGNDFLRFPGETMENQFIDFLIRQEARLPGIRAAAERLYLSLEFGLRKMYEPEEKMNKPLPFTSEDVLSFAKYLVRRMVRARERLCIDGTNRQTAALAFRIALMLEAGDCDISTLVRETNKLRKPDCETALAYLSREGFVKRSGNFWGLTRPAEEFISQFNEDDSDL